MVRAQTSRFTLEETAPIASLIGGWVDPQAQSMCCSPEGNLARIREVNLNLLLQSVG